MLYISSVDDNKDRYGVTDTLDNVEEFYSNSQIVDFIKNKELVIYGTSYYNHRVTCTVIKPNQSVSISKLTDLLNNWKKLHNPWTGIPVEDYLASLRVGTHIRIFYKYYGDGSRRWHDSITDLWKKGDDEWVFEDTTSTMSGRMGNSRFAAYTLEVSVVYGRLDFMKVED